MTKVAGKPTDNVELTIQLQTVIKAELRDGKLKLTFLGGEGKTSSAEYIVGMAAPDLGDFIIQARQGAYVDLLAAIIDEYDDSSDVKSSLVKGLSITGKALYTGAKVGVKVTSQVYQQFLKDSQLDFEEAAIEEDRVGWSGRTGPKGRKAENRVAEALKLMRWNVKGRNIILQAREIDIIAQKGERTYMIECKFGRKQIDTADLDSYVMLYYDAKQRIGVN
ncbi:MAG: YraN family protein, partial [Thaumarchaeota archaeon]|nr:YraN family protein [Nitrososphaerota archaeon]